MESNPVAIAKSTTADSSSPSPVEIFDGNSSPQKIENTPVNIAEATNGASLSPVERARQIRITPAKLEQMAYVSPSFTRSNGGWIRDTAEISVSGVIVIIRPRASRGEKKPKEEDDAEIPEELAVCKFCFNKFVEENVLKTKCNCKTGLAHDKCASHHFNELGNNMCEVCDQEVETTPVTLLRRPFSPKKKKRKNKKHCFGL
ncbi:unnamed protein product [Ilex paraguariensis]|uniref:RING-CH-type domain-containing protein n=1 Tax=Ilex paraguariensis TaxID=185542 RepID=A0ABC8RGK8_9AQUA